MQQQAAVTHPLRYHLLAVSILAVASVLAYLPVSGAELLRWDTQVYINENLAIHEINGSSLLWMLTQTYHANWHPLTWLSHAVDIQIFGFTASGHHWVNVAWHIGCAWLLYLYSLQLIPGLLPSRYPQGSADVYLISLFAALLFAVHPQHVESVAWVAERKDLLCAFFYLLCLYSYDHYVRRPNVASYLLTVCCAAAAIMAKPMAVSLPVVLVLLDLMLYQRMRILFWRCQNWPVLVLEKIPFILLTLVSIYLTLQGQSASGAISSVDATPIIQRLTTSIINWVEYPLATIIPLGLSPYYPYEATIAWPKFLLCGFIVISLLLVAEFYRRRDTAWIMLALMYYSVTLLPVIGIVQIGIIKAADRYAYLPTMPVYLIFAVLVLRALKLNLRANQTVKHVLPRVLFVLMIPLGLGLGTYQLSKVWQSDVTLWEFVREKQADNIYATIYLAEAYYHKQRFDAALPLYQRAYANRELISPGRRLNIFINRYFDTAYRLERYQEAEVAIFTSMQENRLWFMPAGDVYYNAALVNFKMARYETALQLLDLASREGGEEERFQLLRKQVISLMENQP